MRRSSEGVGESAQKISFVHQYETLRIAT